MKRYNFDTVPKKASGYSVHAMSMLEALKEAQTLAKRYGEKSLLRFRDNKKCIKSKYSYCEICWPK